MTNTETTDLVRYVAEVNVPGYLPMTDEPAVFETAEAAWAYLADERERGEDDACDETCEEGPTCRWGYTNDYTDTVTTLRALATDTIDTDEIVSCMVNAERVGSVYADTPGYHGEHDLGLAYSVTQDDSLVPLAEAAVKGYVTAMLWANAACDVEDCPDRGAGDCDHSSVAPAYDLSDFSAEDQASMTNDVCDFIAGNEDDFREYVERIDYNGRSLSAYRAAENFGHDFALTRNGHGAGFWDRGLGDLGDRLTTAAKVYGESSVYVNDEGVTLS